MTAVYATSTQYEDGPPTRTAPANIDALLISASLLVYDETVTAVYPVDSTGTPIDPNITAALTQATCAQAAVWAGLGIDPDRAGLDVPAPKRSKGVGSARIDYDTSATSSAATVAARQQALTELCPTARGILRQAKLLSTRAWRFG